MKKYYWVCKRKDGSIAEGFYSVARRMFGRLFLGETFIKVGVWHD